MTASRLGLLLLLVSLPGLLTPAMAATYRVRADGAGDFTSIQAAVNAARAGDTIVVQGASAGAPLIYPERITFSTTNSGTTTRPLTIVASPRRSVEMRGFDTNKANYVTIRGFDITNTLTGWNEIQGVFIRSDGVQVLDCYFHELPQAVACGWTVPYPGDGVIRDCRAYRCQTGLMIYGNRFLVEHNEVERLVQFNKNADCDYSRFFGSDITFRDNYFHGALSDEVGAAHVDGFQTFDNNGEIAQNVLIENNRVFDFHEGLMLSGTAHPGSHQNLTVRNNIFCGGNLGGSYGIAAGGILNMLVLNNLFTNLKYHGVALTDKTTATVRNNIFDQAGSDYWADTGASFASGHNRLDLTAKHCAPTDLVGINPGFVDAANRDFHLRPDSALIDQGANLGAEVKTDLEETSRPQGRAYDIGPYEFHSRTTSMPFPTWDPLRSRLTLDYADTLAAPPGAWVTLWGVNFGDPPTSGYVQVGGQVVRNYASWSNTRIDFQVPPDAISGPLTVTANGRRSNTLAFIITRGRLYFVDPDRPGASDSNPGSAEQPWVTLAHAARAALPGDTVYLRAHVYTEPLEPLGHGPASLPIMFKAYPNEMVVLDGAAAAAPDGVHLDGLDQPDPPRLIVSGLILENFDNAVHLARVADCGLYGLTVQHCQTGLLLAGARDCQVAQVQLLNNGISGCRLNNATAGVVLRDCWADHNQLDGFAADPTCDKLLLQRCAATNNADVGFNLQAKTHELRESIATDNLSGINLWQDATVQNILAVGNRQCNIKCQSVAGATATQTFLNCTLIGGEAFGMEIGPAVEVDIQNSIVVGSTGPAIYFHAPEAGEVMEHVIVHSLTMNDGNNVIAWDAAARAAPAADPWTAVDAALGAPNLQTDMITVIDNPALLFQSMDNGNFELSADSLARRYGDGGNAPPVDLLRRLRPQTGAVDAGAYEYFAPDRVVPRAWAGYQ